MEIARDVIIIFSPAKRIESVIRAVAKNAAHTVPEIAEDVGLPQADTRQIVLELVEQGVLEKRERYTVGGESGAGARPCRVEHIRSIVRQCKAADVPVFVKQMGSNAISSALIDAPPFPCSVEMTWNGAGVGSYSVKFNNRKGGDMSEWPEDLRIREMPK